MQAYKGSPTRTVASISCNPSAPTAIERAEALALALADSLASLERLERRLQCRLVVESLGSSPARQLAVVEPAHEPLQHQKESQLLALVDPEIHAGSDQPLPTHHQTLHPTVSIPNQPYPYLRDFAYRCKVVLCLYAFYVCIFGQPEKLVEALVQGFHCGWTSRVNNVWTCE